MQGKLALDAIVPKRLGSWYVKAGARYYHIINDALAGGAGVHRRPRRARPATFPNAHRDVGVVYAGLGFGF